MIGLTNMIARHDRRKCEVKKPKVMVCLAPGEATERNICFYIPHSTAEKRRRRRNSILCLRLAFLLCFCLSLDLFEITQWPALVEIGLGRLVKTEVGEPALTRDGWNPIRLESRRSGRTAINVHGGVGVFLQVHARRTVGDFLFVYE